MPLLLALILAAGCDQDDAAQRPGAPDAGAPDTSAPRDAALDAAPDAVPDMALDAASDVALDAASDVALDAAPDTAPEADIAPPEPTYWSPEATQVADDLVFVEIEGTPFFAIGFDTMSRPVWDGQAGPGACDDQTGDGLLDIQVEKNLAAAEAGANFAYVWGYGDHGDTLVATEPQLYGKFSTSWGVARPTSDDVIPILYNAFGEEDMTDPSQENIERMRQTFEAFRDRAGAFSPESMPNLPPFEELPWMSWHPSFRMIGTGAGEEVTPGQADALARTTNMMIGDNYRYVENRYDMEDPIERIAGSAHGQIGPKGEGYDDWLARDDPQHRYFFSASWDLARSIVERREAGTVVWMWMQGYAFDDGVGEEICRTGSSSSWAVGSFPTDAYLRKEIASTIAAGGTGIIFFGWFLDRWPEAERVMALMRALSHPEVYEPALTSPRLVLGIDTAYMGEPGYDGLGRAHVMVKWHEETRTAYVIAANPGARETTIELDFPWTLARAEILDWTQPAFVESDELRLWDRTLTYTIPRDDGVILRLTPLVAD